MAARSALRTVALAAGVLALAGCERGGEAPPSGGFENEQVVTPAEVPADAGEPGARPGAAGRLDAPLGDPEATPPDSAGTQ